MHTFRTKIKKLKIGHLFIKKEPINLVAIFYFILSYLGVSKNVLNQQNTVSNLLFVAPFLSLQSIVYHIPKWK